MAVPRYFIRVTRGRRPGVSRGHFAQSSVYIKLIFGGLTADPLGSYYLDLVIFCLQHTTKRRHVLHIFSKFIFFNNIFLWVKLDAKHYKWNETLFDVQNAKVQGHGV